MVEKNQSRHYWRRPIVETVSKEAIRVVHCWCGEMPQVHKISNQWRKQHPTTTTTKKKNVRE